MDSWNQHRIRWRTQKERAGAHRAPHRRGDIDPHQTQVSGNQMHKIPVITLDSNCVS